MLLGYIIFALFFYAFAIIVDSDGVTIAAAIAAAAAAPSPLSLHAYPHSLIFFHTLILHFGMVSAMSIVGMHISIFLFIHLLSSLSLTMQKKSAQYTQCFSVFTSLLHHPFFSPSFLSTLFCCVYQKKMWVCIKFLREDEQCERESERDVKREGREFSRAYIMQ